MGRLRTLVIEDSLTVRKQIVEVLRSDPDIEVVGEAADGKRAIELCGDLRPDVITLDMMLPVMTGLAVTEYVMAYFPTPILIVSASTNRGELFRTYEALAAGAIDVLEKPTGDEVAGEWERQLLQRLKMVARIPVVTHPRAKLGRLGILAPVAPRWVDDEPSPSPRGVLAVGASTGGPAAVLHLLQALPESLGLPILVVIHIGEPFSTALADWLGGASGRTVRAPEPGEELSSLDPAVVLLAPPGRHLVVDGEAVVLVDGPERHSCKPSVDVLFESVARHHGSRAIACLLTGMGRDGAEGLLAVRRAGGETLAQDESTSVVFGMPGEAVRLGAARHVAPLDDLAPLIVRLARGTAREALRP